MFFVHRELRVHLIDDNIAKIVLNYFGNVFNVSSFSLQLLHKAKEQKVRDWFEMQLTYPTGFVGKQITDNFQSHSNSTSVHVAIPEEFFKFQGREFMNVLEEVANERGWSVQILGRECTTFEFDLDPSRKKQKIQTMKYW